ncbi:FAD-binding oxidoreductase [Actinoplanes rectilineatus]|uniref:FAD-binding oxidoreductase n=1 Tax=Actinoplanes rectilineatus TaxID=113571 RepID=UPI000697DA6A|nr:FAD-binding oxidoreductase [Actinoplanes rectilineatus]
MRLTRRALLTGGLGLLIPPPPGPDWKALAAGVDGAVLLPGQAGYDSARRLVDPRFDRIRPPAVVRCSGAGDVAEAVRFARTSRLPVVVRGGGHSYAGASVSSTALVLDVRELDDVHADPASGTATIGGGALLGDVYQRLHTAGRGIPSGSCATVGIGGITCGGGIGRSASAWGLTCDAVVAAEVVTADGQLRTVDADREPDLFWALRGGGGGAFGVVTSWRMRTFPAGTGGSFVMAYPWEAGPQVAAGWQRRIAAAPDEAWSVCRFVTDAEGRCEVRLGGLVLGGDADDEVAVLGRAVGREPASVTVELVTYPEVPAPVTRRATDYVGSEVFRQELPPAAVEALMAVVAQRARDRRPGSAELKRMTGAPARVPAGATAYPWRDARTVMQWLVRGVDDATARPWIEAGHRAMAPWSAGRYVNYLEPGSTDSAVYHGAHLDRLRSIRAASDPDGLFRHVPPG